MGRQIYYTKKNLCKNSLTQRGYSRVFGVHTPNMSDMRGFFVCVYSTIIRTKSAILSIVKNNNKGILMPKIVRLLLPEKTSLLLVLFLSNAYGNKNKNQKPE
jgi:hypothetical protein